MGCTICFYFNKKLSEPNRITNRTATVMKLKKISSEIILIFQNVTKVNGKLKVNCKTFEIIYDQKNCTHMNF